MTKVGLARRFPLNSFDGLCDRDAELSEQGQNWRSNKSVNTGLVDEYARGALSIIIKFNGTSCGKSPDWHRSLKPHDKYITFHACNDTPVRIQNSKGRVAGGPKNGGEENVLINIVHLVEMVEVTSIPISE